MNTCSSANQNEILDIRSFVLVCLLLYCYFNLYARDCDDLTKWVFNAYGYSENVSKFPSGNRQFCFCADSSAY